MRRRPIKVVHLSSVHTSNDNRIFNKECRTLAESGYDVVFVAPGEGERVQDGVKIKTVPYVKNRIIRALVTTWRVFVAGISERGDVFHFHDPELIPVGLLLRLMGKIVIYDVHEDYVTSIKQKPYLPRLIRSLLAYLFGWFERAASQAFTVILAERYYLRRFPKGTLVLNYPRLELIHTSSIHREGNGRKKGSKYKRLIYTGNVTVDRGALVYARMVAEIPDIEITVVGRCPTELAAEMRRIAGSGASRLKIIGEGYFVPFEKIAAFYRSDEWIAGLAVFPRTPHYVQKELTKFFEYMAAEIPIICSNFPVWQELVEGNGVGICVDPDDMESIRRAIEKLTENEDIATAMGQRGKKAVAERFNWDVEAAKLLSLYDRLTTYKNYLPASS